MNKKLISAAVLLGMSGAASAVNLNPDGLGSVLMYPYYTTTGGKFTNVEIVNTTNETKAVKVRFNEGVNTWEVLDFNLYLSPYDVWTGVVSLKDGKPSISTSDTSCTVPKLTTKEFRDSLIKKYSKSHKDPATNAKGDITNAMRLAEGHLEVFEMGVINDTPRGEELQGYIKHENDVPANCAKVKAAWSDGRTWTKKDPNGTTIAAPTGGLFGTASIVDVKNGTALGYDATAINGFYMTPAHAYPGSSFPNIAGLSNDGGVTRPTASLISEVIDPATNSVVRTLFRRPIQAISSVLMATGIHNRYFTADSALAATDWVVTFPTKHAFVNVDTSNSTTTTGSYFDGQYGMLPTETTGQKYGVAPFSGFAVPVTTPYWNTEEADITPDLDFSPTTIDNASISYEVNVLKLGKERSVFESHLENAIGADFGSGWMSVNFTGGQLVGTDIATGEARAFNGFPVIGFSALEVQNKNATTNFSAAYNHKYTRSITSVGK